PARRRPHSSAPRARSSAAAFSWCRLGLSKQRIDELLHARVRHDAIFLQKAGEIALLVLALAFLAPALQHLAFDLLERAQMAGRQSADANQMQPLARF